MELSTTRRCAACGQVIDPLTDAWKTEGGKMRHVTCPTSAALRDLPTITEAAPSAGRLQFLTMNEAAEMMRVDRTTIRRWIRSGKLPAKKLPGAAQAGVRILQSDLLALLEDAREAA